jgi:hypothetical protein
MADDKPRPVIVEIFTAARASINSEQSDTVEIDRAEWDAMTPAERSRLCDELADTTAYNRFEWGWNIKDEQDMAQTSEGS